MRSSLCFLILLFARFALSAPGELDPRFGSGGSRLADPGEQYNDVAVDSQGRIYILRDGGPAECANDCGVMTRLTADGRPDLTFGPAGRRVVSTAPFVGYESGTAVLGTVTVQPDDKVLFVSLSGSVNGAIRVVHRLNSDGTPDGGFTPINSGVTPGGEGKTLVVPYPDGRILFASPSSIKRYLSNGSEDPAFSSIGAVTAWQSIALSPDGGVIIGGSSRGIGTILRRLPDGAPDTSFGSGGTVTLFEDISMVQPGRLQKVAVQPDGKILVAAARNSSRYYPYYVHVYRLTQTGAVDGGASLPDPVSTPEIAGLAVQPDGGILVVVQDGRARVARISPAAALDPTFGNGGVTTIDLAPAEELPTDARLQAGRGLVLGVRGSDSQFRVARVRVDGNPIRLDPEWLSPAGLGRPYSVTLKAVGGAAPYSIAPYNNALPPGLSLVNNVLSGIPTVAGEYRFFLEATDSTSASATRFYVFSVHTPASLIESYYRSVLRRVPDASGRSFWEGEVTRMIGLGASANDVFQALSSVFFASPEYAGVIREHRRYVADLYATFFSRDGDATGLDYWTAQIAAGKPREAVLNDFQFSAEFLGTMTQVFGPVTTRAETSMVIDFYRGILGRLPDSDGFDYWVGRFRTAQCSGKVAAEADAVSAAFLGSAEYANRQSAPPFGQSSYYRDLQFVVDLYNGFLRRGSDATGFQYWFNQLRTGVQTREQLRQAFVRSPEFQARVAAVQAESCRP